MVTFEKQPADVQDYDVNYNPYLTKFADTGSTVVVAADTGITVAATTLTSGVVKVWLSGGLDGYTYQITTTLTTSGGRVKQHEFAVKVRNS
jgi:hypothetical protein